mgnify:CR=1 FL=1
MVARTLADSVGPANAEIGQIFECAAIGGLFERSQRALGQRSIGLGLLNGGVCSPSGPDQMNSVSQIGVLLRFGIHGSVPEQTVFI